MDLVVLPLSEVNALPEYSCSLPTGTTIGKRWKCRTRQGTWVLGEYVVSELPGMVGIRWSRIVIGEEMVLEAVAGSALSLYSRTRSLPKMSRSARRPKRTSHWRPRADQGRDYWKHCRCNECRPWLATLRARAGVTKNTEAT